MSKLIAFLLAQLLFFSFKETNGVTLESFSVDENLLTVSGFSSGGTMAQQMFVSYSSIFKGFSTISHAFYRCDGNGTDYTSSCTNAPKTDGKISQMYPPSKAITEIETYAKLGLIDPPKNMEDKPIYVFAGSSNFLFNLHLGLGPVTVFEPFINDMEKIKIRVQAAGLTLPTDRLGLPNCTADARPLFVSSCGFSAAFEGLEWMLGPGLIQPARKGIQLQPLLEFNQTEFFQGFGEDFDVTKGPGMDSTGFLYVPKQCGKKKGTKCLLHIYFHGCFTGRDFVGANHILNSGYLELAQTNGIIMLFPQIAAGSKINAAGCWDVFGYTGQFYATRIGPQVIVVKNMVDRILGSGLSEADSAGEKTLPSSFIWPHFGILYFLLSIVY